MELKVSIGKEDVIIVDCANHETLNQISYLFLAELLKFKVKKEEEFSSTSVDEKVSVLRVGQPIVIKKPPIGS